MSVLEYVYDEPTSMWRIVEPTLPAGQYSLKMCPTYLEYNGKMFSIADAVKRPRLDAEERVNQWMKGMQNPADCVGYLGVDYILDKEKNRWVAK